MKIKREIQIDGVYVPSITTASSGFYVDSMPGYEMIPCPDGKPGCCVAYYRKRIDPEQVRREELIENEISGIFE